MALFSKWTYNTAESTTWRYPNYWDFIALCLVFGFFALLALGAKQMASPYELGQVLPISLSPSMLPYYALRSVLRMLIALVCSLVFTFIVGTAAAKNRHVERIVIPLIDVLQSVPVLGYLSITVVAFIAVFPGSLLGPECAAIFAIFTSQVWNMVLSFYQSIRIIPQELCEAADMLHLSPWQRFWRLEVPFAMPGLLWNMMMSMSASWFFVVASEAITVSNQTITLPGIGSYIALAVSQANLQAIGYAIIAMFVVILLYDQLLFRPLSQWTEKFKFEHVTQEEEPNSWLVQLFQKTRFLRSFRFFFIPVFDFLLNNRFTLRKIKMTAPSSHTGLRKSILVVWYCFLFLMCSFILFVLLRFVFHSVSLAEGKQVLLLGLYTAIRVMTLILLASLVWIPLGVWIGLRPKVAHIAQPLIQFLASFPVNLFYPIAVMVIVYCNLNVNIWSSPLMILGTQWYIAFNVIAGTLSLPKDLQQVASNLNVRGWLWWKRLILPGIFPYYLTGAITAAGGAWNASIIAESLSWGQNHLQAKGLGAYITASANSGDFPRLALGITIMCLYVLLINRTLWRPLYQVVIERFQFSGS